MSQQAGAGATTTSTSGGDQGGVSLSAVIAISCGAALISCVGAALVIILVLRRTKTLAEHARHSRAMASVDEDCAYFDVATGDGTSSTTAPSRPGTSGISEGRRGLASHPQSPPQACSCLYLTPAMSAQYERARPLRIVRTPPHSPSATTRHGQPSPTPTSSTTTSQLCVPLGALETDDVRAWTRTGHLSRRAMRELGARVVELAAAHAAVVSKDVVDMLSLAQQTTGSDGDEEAGFRDVEGAAGGPRDRSQRRFTTRMPKRCPRSLSTPAIVHGIPLAAAATDEARQDGALTGTATRAPVRADECGEAAGVDGSASTAAAFTRRLRTRDPHSHLPMLPVHNRTDQHDDDAGHSQQPQQPDVCNHMSPRGVVPMPSPVERVGQQELLELLQRAAVEMAQQQQRWRTCGSERPTDVHTPPEEPPAEPHPDPADERSSPAPPASPRPQHLPHLPFAPHPPTRPRSAQPSPSSRPAFCDSTCSSPHPSSRPSSVSSVSRAVLPPSPKAASCSSATRRFERPLPAALVRARSRPDLNEANRLALAALRAEAGVDPTIRSAAAPAVDMQAARRGGGWQRSSGRAGGARSRTMSAAGAAAVYSPSSSDDDDLRVDVREKPLGSHGIASSRDASVEGSDEATDAISSRSMSPIMQLTPRVPAKPNQLELVTPPSTAGAAGSRAMVRVPVRQTRSFPCAQKRKSLATARTRATPSGLRLEPKQEAAGAGERV